MRRVKIQQQKRSRASGEPHNRLICSVLIKSILDGKWLVYSSPSGELFYQNRATQFCTWNIPTK
jgi:hypothetical protein